jgi:putative transcriptional regulator
MSAMALHADRPSAGSEFLTGRLLIAMPGIGDPRFERAVILVCAHAEDHAMGIRLDQPAPGLTMVDLIRKLEVEGALREPQRLVLVGGPVQTERGFVLHTDEETFSDSTPVGDGLLLTASREVLHALASPRPPRRALLALGYAGWGAGQLENELRENVWLAGPADEDLIFDEDHDTKWERALARMGVRAEMLSAQAGRA